MLYTNQGQFTAAIYQGKITREFLASLSDEEILQVCKTMFMRTEDYVTPFKWHHPKYFTTAQDFLNLAEALKLAINDGVITADERVHANSQNGFSSGTKTVPYSRAQLESALWIRVAAIKNKQTLKLQRKREREALRAAQKENEKTITVNGKTYKLVMTEQETA